MKSTWSHANAPKVVKGENVLPTDETLTEDQLIAGSYLTNFITNPLPSEKLNDRLGATGLGQQYAMIDNIKNVRIAPAQKTFSLILGNSAPVYEMGDWLENMKDDRRRSYRFQQRRQDQRKCYPGRQELMQDIWTMKWIQEHPKNKTGIYARNCSDKEYRLGGFDEEGWK